jgi:hypothetical protein
VDTFAREQLTLELEAGLAPAPPAAAIAAERAVTRDDTVARDDQADRAPANGAADGAGSAGPADHPRDLAVTRRRARPDAPNRGEDESIPGRPILEVDGQVVEGRRVTAQELFEGASGSIEVADGSGTLVPRLPGLDRRGSEPNPETDCELLG